jgi:hypothetical protein
MEQSPKLTGAQFILGARVQADHADQNDASAGDAIAGHLAGIRLTLFGRAAECVAHSRLHFTARSRLMVGAGRPARSHAVAEPASDFAGGFADPHGRPWASLVKISVN